MNRFLGLIAVAFLLAVAPLHAQHREDPPLRRHFVGTSGFMLFNLLPESPDFYQLNYGYRLTSRDVISVEAITWKYTAPLGIPYGPSMGSPDEAYPGHVREFGLGVAYQRFVWRDAYAAVHAVPLRKHYVDENEGRVQDGFQLFLTARAGYHVRLFQDRLFLEPSVAFTHWPISTNAPAAFEERDRRWPNYFLFEPGLHLGVRF